MLGLRSYNDRVRKGWARAKTAEREMAKERMEKGAKMAKAKASWHNFTTCQRRVFRVGSMLAPSAAHSF